MAPAKIGGGSLCSAMKWLANLIAGTTTRTWLKIEAGLDAVAYPKGIQVTIEKLEKIKRQRADFHSE